jgi:heterodisulfide reductase subunit B
MSKRVAYYPGCSLHGTSAELDSSFRATSSMLGLELAEIPGWECCGNTAVHAASRLLAAALPANELTKVRADMHLDTVVVPCAACFSRFMVGRHELDVPEMKADIERVIGRSAQGDVAVRNLVDVYYQEVGLEALAAKVERPFNGLKVAAYYGCLLTRPPEMTLADDPEYPTHMEDVLRVLGCAPVDWSSKTDCCGASLALCEHGVVVDLVHKILRNAVQCGAEAVVCACPLCQVNLDSRQDAIKRLDPAWQPVPVLFLSQVVGRAIGAPAASLGVRKHMVPVERALA